MIFVADPQPCLAAGGRCSVQLMTIYHTYHYIYMYINIMPDRAKILHNILLFKVVLMTFEVVFCFLYYYSAECDECDHVWKCHKSVEYICDSPYC